MNYSDKMLKGKGILIIIISIIGIIVPIVNLFIKSDLVRHLLFGYEICLFMYLIGDTILNIIISRQCKKEYEEFLRKH